MVGEELSPQTVVNLSVTNVPTCVSHNVKTLELQHLQLLDVPSGSRPRDRTCVVHHNKDENNRHTLLNEATGCVLENAPRRSKHQVAEEGRWIA